MNNWGAQLTALGFVPDEDFICRDDADGNADYIWRWLSAEPCPFPEAIREPIEPE